jgi:hypothetical protein
MDPYVTWKLFLTCLNNEDVDGAKEALIDLVCWIEVDGYVPGNCPLNAAGIRTLNCGFGKD